VLDVSVVRGLKTHGRKLFGFSLLTLCCAKLLPLLTFRWESFPFFVDVRDPSGVMSVYCIDWCLGWIRYTTSERVVLSLIHGSTDILETNVTSILL